MVAKVCTLSLPDGVFVHGRAVGDDLPVRGRGDGDVEGGLQVGLVEAREHPLGVGGLELRVQVHLVVDGVDEAVQPLTGVASSAQSASTTSTLCSARPVSAMPVDSS